MSERKLLEMVAGEPRKAAAKLARQAAELRRLRKALRLVEVMTIHVAPKASDECHRALKPARRKP